MHTSYCELLRATYAGQAAVYSCGFSKEIYIFEDNNLLQAVGFQSAIISQFISIKFTSQCVSKADLWLNQISDNSRQTNLAILTDSYCHGCKCYSLMSDPPLDVITCPRLTDDDVLMSKKREKGHLRWRYESKQGPSAASCCLSACCLRSNEFNDCVQWAEQSYSVCLDYCVCFS